MTRLGILERRPALGYFVLVFVISWGAVVVTVGPTELLQGASPETWQILPIFGSMLLGPPLAGLALLASTDGRAGLRDLWTRQTRWRVDLRWYAIALLTTPVLLLVILGGLSLTSPRFVPLVVATDDLAGVLLFGLVAGAFAGFLEEIGWTGFALPRLRTRYALLTAGLLLGVIWGVWHGLADYWATHAEFADLWLPRIALWTAALTPYRLLLAWVYEHTRSLLVAQLMHASFTGSQAVLVPPVSPGDHLLWYGLFTAALWVVAGVVALSVWGRDDRRTGVSGAG